MATDMCYVTHRCVRVLTDSTHTTPLTMRVGGRKGEGGGKKRSVGIMCTVYTRVHCGI